MTQRFTNQLFAITAAIVTAMPAPAQNNAPIDVHGALEGHDELIPDKVHPNTEGATLIAEAVFKGLTGKPAPVPAAK